MFHQFLSDADAGRALSTFRKLGAHDIGDWALTGGLAIEIHHIRLGLKPGIRALNDIDFIAGSFDCIPGSLADAFLFRHIHPLDPAGKTILQFVDADSAVRGDVFRACGASMSRTSLLHLPQLTIRLVSPEDLMARTARLVLDLAGNVPVPAKHARDFLRLMNVVRPEEIEPAWQDHRKPNQPATFERTVAFLRTLIPASEHLLITPEYSTNTEEVCLRCAPTGRFDPEVILSLLGYC